MLAQQSRQQQPPIAVELQVRGVPDQQALQLPHARLDVGQGLKLLLDRIPGGRGYSNRQDSTRSMVTTTCPWETADTTSR